MTVSDPSQDDSGVLKRRLAEISRDRLIDEVVDRWEDVNRMEGDIANLRRRLREAELVSRSGGSDGAIVAEMEERVRVAEAKMRNLEGRLQNEMARREGAEAESRRVGELQEENARLLRNEEELLLLVLDMEAQIERLTSKLAFRFTLLSRPFFVRIMRRYYGFAARSRLALRSWKKVERGMSAKRPVSRGRRVRAPGCRTIASRISGIHRPLSSNPGGLEPGPLPSHPRKRGTCSQQSSRRKLPCAHFSELAASCEC